MVMKKLLADGCLHEGIEYPGKVLDCSIYAKELGKKPLIRAFAERRRPRVGKHEFNPLLLLTTTVKPAFQSVTW